MTEIKRGRKPMPADRKKVKLTLTVRPDIRDELDRIATGCGLSMSEMVEKFVMDRIEAETALLIVQKEAAAKAARKAAREAKKAAKAAVEPQCENQMRFTDTDMNMETE